MTFLEAVEAMKQGKRVFSRYSKKVGPIKISGKHFVWDDESGNLFMVLLDDIEATDWEIYEEPKEMRTVVRYEWAYSERHSRWVTATYWYSDDEHQKQFKDSVFKWKRLDHTRTEFEEEVE